MLQKGLFWIFIMNLCLVTLILAGNKGIPLNQSEPAEQILAGRPPLDFRVHDVGTLWNTVTNFGRYGDPAGQTPSMEWPGGSVAEYLWSGGLWIGALRGNDPLVTHYSSSNNEWLPSEGSIFEFAPSKSNLDSYVIYDDLAEQAGHTSLGIQVSQRALTWNAPGFDDFIAYEYEIVNIGDQILRDLFIGWFYDCDVGTGVDATSPGGDDLVDYDGWHSSGSTHWHGLPPNLTTAHGEYIDIVENIDQNFNNVLDGYDQYGVPYGDPYNPRHDPAKIHPDGIPDEWQVFVNANGDTILIPRGISLMYDGDDPNTEEEDTGELSASPVNATGYIGGRLLYAPIAAFHETADDTIPRIHSHQWWDGFSDPGDDFIKYKYLSGQTPGGKIFTHPLDVDSTVFDYRFLNSAGPFTELMPGDTLRVVYASAVAQGLMGIRETLDNALNAYYSGSEHSDPLNPSDPIADYHWEIAGAPIAKDIRALPVFAQPGKDSVTISARVYDIDGSVTAVQANIHLAEGSLVETIALVDNGTLGDKTPNDGIYTNVWPVSQENFYTVSIYTQDNEGNEITREKVARFTGAGPLEIKNIHLASDDPTPSPLEDIIFQIETENLGHLMSIENTVIKIKTVDEIVTASLLPLVYLGESLQPGESRMNDTDLMIRVADDCPDGHVVEFEAEILSGNFVYWRDTFSITIVDDKAPLLLDVLGDRYCNPGEPAKISVKLMDGAGVKEVRADIQSPDDSTIVSVNLVNTQDDIFEADWVILADPPQDYDVDLYLVDNLENAMTVENAAGFTTKSFVPQNKILLVDNDNYNYPSYSSSKKPYESYYTAAMDSNQVDYDVYSVYFHGPVDSTLLKFYQDGMIIWETGDTRFDDSSVRSKSALDLAEQAVLMNYLDHGGKLFLTGQGTCAADEPSATFFNDYLGVSILTRDINRRNVLPVKGETISAGINARFVGGTGANNQVMISSLVPLKETTTSIFKYPNKEAAAVKVEINSNSQIIYFAFGFESINSDKHRITLMSRIIQWLGFPTTVKPKLSNPVIPKTFSLHQNFPNPFNPVTTIRYDLPSENHVTIQVLNLLGQQVAVLVDRKQRAGTYDVNWQAAGFSSGLYIIRFAAGEFKYQRKVLLLK